jgi:L-threonylcarbamoyladenylate synthase
MARTAAPASAAAEWQSMPTDPVAYAHNLYATLRRLDALNCPRILVEAMPVAADWAAVTDRLRRAATGSGPGA